MKKILTILFCAVIVTSFVFAQDVYEGEDTDEAAEGEVIKGKNKFAASLAANGTFTVSGEVKTGFYWYERQIGDNEKESEGFVHNNEDDTFDESIGIKFVNRDQGRFRLNMHLDYSGYGMKLRFEQKVWTESAVPRWSYAFAYGNFIKDQLKLSVGRLGDSPWATGAPEQYLNELDTQIGLRFEIKPRLPKPAGELNIGLVLNDKNEQLEYDMKSTLLDMLMESVIGLSYKHDYFNVRLAYRLDSKIDVDFGDQLIFRIEETAIKNRLPGFQIWALGAYKGLRTDDPSRVELVNWLYINYDPDFDKFGLTAEARLGHDLYEERHRLYVRPSFYAHFFDRLLTFGLAFEYVQDFGENKPYWDESPYLRMLIEPMIKVNLGTAYIALVYQHRRAYIDPDETQTTVNAVNLRVLFAF